MRRKLRAPEGAETLTYLFHFQISSKGGRQACTVQVQSPNFHDATTYFRQNWPKIEVHSARPSGQWKWRPPHTEASLTRRPKYARCETRKTCPPEAAKKV